MLVGLDEVGHEVGNGVLSGGSIFPVDYSFGEDTAFSKDLEEHSNVTGVGDGFEASCGKFAALCAVVEDGFDWSRWVPGGSEPFGVGIEVVAVNGAIVGYEVVKDGANGNGGKLVESALEDADVNLWHSFEELVLQLAG